MLIILTMFYRVKNNSIYKNNYTIKFYIKKKC